MTDTKSQVILDTIKFSHLYLSVPMPSAEDTITHGLQVVASAIRVTPPPTSVSQLEAITALQETLSHGAHLLPHPYGQPTTRLLHAQG